MFSRNEENNQNFNSTSYKNLNLNHLNQNGLELNRISPINKSRIAPNVNKTSRIHNDIRFSSDFMQDMKLKASSKNEQAGSIEPQPKRKVQMNNIQPTDNIEGKETGGQQLYSRSNSSIKSIHNLHEEKRKKLLTKYSKENLIKSVKQPKVSSKAALINNSPQHAEPYLNKVSKL